MTDTIDLDDVETAELLEALQSRAESELASLESQVARARTAYEELRDTHRQRQAFFKKLGATPTEEQPEVSCKHPGCDRTFGTPQGAAAHFTRTHKKPKAVAPRDPNEGSDPNGRLHCASCEYRCDSTDALVAHTSRGHGRRPYNDERTPK